MNQEGRSRRLQEGMSAATDAVRMLAQGSTFATLRSDVVTARETVRRAMNGEDADLRTAAGLLDQVLEGLCPHDPESRFESYADSGELLITCTACGVSWYAPDTR